MTTLEIQTRDKSVENASLRKSGFLPAVVYGKKTPSTPITISAKEFAKVWKEAGESGVVNLKGGPGNFDVLIHEISWNAASDKPDHVDFYAFEKGKKIEVDVPLEFVGLSAAVKDLGGNLIKVLRELKVSADPQHIPRFVSVDISALKTFEDQIVASDIALPAGVTLVEKPEEVVASVEEPKAEEVEAPAAPVDLSAIEVEKKGKKDEEAAAAPEK